MELCIGIYWCESTQTHTYFISSLCKLLPNQIAKQMPLIKQGSTFPEEGGLAKDLRT